MAKVIGIRNAVALLLMAILLTAPLPAFAEDIGLEASEDLIPPPPEGVERNIIGIEGRKLEEKKRMKGIVDVILGYKYFIPRDDPFRDKIENTAAPYIGLDFMSILGVGVESINYKVSGSDKISGKALNLTLTYPYAFNGHTLVYAGGGGRLEQIEVKDADSTATFDNNAILLTAGAKFRFIKSHGIEINYSSTISAGRVDYHMLRVGILLGIVQPKSEKNSESLRGY